MAVTGHKLIASMLDAEMREALAFNERLMKERFDAERERLKYYIPPMIIDRKTVESKPPARWDMPHWYSNPSAVGFGKDDRIPWYYNDQKPELGSGKEGTYPSKWFPGHGLLAGPVTVMRIGSPAAWVGKLSKHTHSAYFNHLDEDKVNSANVIGEAYELCCAELRKQGCTAFRTILQWDTTRAKYSLYVEGGQ